MSVDVLEKVDVKITVEDNYKVIMHNDDKTTMEFVVYLLMDVFQKTQDQAFYLMLTIHNSGYAVIAEYSNFDIAEQKVYEATNIAKEYSYPLKLTIEQ